MIGEQRRGLDARRANERRTSRRLVACLWALLALPAAPACSGVNDEGATDTGTALIELTAAPEGVGCVAVTARGAHTTTRSFDVSVGIKTEFYMLGLPTGIVTFTANAFGKPCAGVPGGAIPSWISDDVTVSITPDALANVALRMHRNGQADVSVDWDSDRKQPTSYEPFEYTSQDGVLGQNRGIGWAAAWGPGMAFTAYSDGFATNPDSLTYSGLANAGGRVRVTARSLITAMSRQPSPVIRGDIGTSRYVSFLLRPEGVLDEGNSGGFFGLVLSSPSFNAFIGKPGGGQIHAYVVEDYGGGGQVASAIPTVVGEDALLVVKVEFQQDADRLTLYVNPEVGAPEPATGTVKMEPAGEINSISIVSAGAFSIDEIRIGATFASVTPALP